VNDNLRAKELHRRLNELSDLAELEQEIRTTVLDEVERRITDEFERAIGSIETNAGRRVLRVLNEMKKER
jgi:hypothetical protein